MIDTSSRRDLLSCVAKKKRTIQEIACSDDTINDVFVKDVVVKRGFLFVIFESLLSCNHY